MFRFVPSRTLKTSASGFEGKTLIVGAVSIGNVGQLCVDLLVNSTKAIRVGYFDTDLVHALCGYNAFAHNIDGGEEPNEVVLHLALEVYEIPNSNYIFLHQRSVTVKGKSKAVADEVVNWAKMNNIEKIVCLSGGNAEWNTDKHMGRPFWLVSVGADREKLEKQLEINSLNDSLNEFEQFVGKHGHAKTLRDACEAQEIPFVCLLMLCAEGDNTPHAFALSSLANELLELLPEKSKEKIAEGMFSSSLVAPPSWTGFYGDEVDQSLYG